MICAMHRADLEQKKRGTTPRTGPCAKTRDYCAQYLAILFNIFNSMRTWNRKKRDTTPKSISDADRAPDSLAMMRRMMGTMARKILSARPTQI